MNETPPPGVSIVTVEISFWNLVVFCIKFWLAQLVALALIGGFIGLMALLNVVSWDAISDRLN